MWWRTVSMSTNNIHEWMQNNTMFCISLKQLTHTCGLNLRVEMQVNRCKISTLCILLHAQIQSQSIIKPNTSGYHITGRKLHFSLHIMPLHSTHTHTQRHIIAQLLCHATKHYLCTLVSEKCITGPWSFVVLEEHSLPNACHAANTQPRLDSARANVRCTSPNTHSVCVCECRASKATPVDMFLLFLGGR